MLVRRKIRNTFSEDDLKTVKTSLKPPPSVQNHVPGVYHGFGDGTTTRHAMSRKPICVEIAPGVPARLRGFEETKAYVGRDFFLPCLCYCCTLNVFCIMDANYVICPVCRVVNPLEGGADLNYPAGVGLGFTAEDLAAWQAEFRRNYSSNATFRGNI